MESRVRFTPIDAKETTSFIGANMRTEDLKALVLHALDTGESLPKDFLEELSISELIGHLKLAHRYYLNTKLPEIEQSIYALYDHQTKADQLLVILCSFFIEYKEKLVEHIKLEERILFPYIEYLQGLKPLHQNGNVDFSDFSIHKFEVSHSNLEEDLARVRQQIMEAINQLKTPLPFRIFVTQLEFFENDMAVHAYLEDEVLIPKVLQLEQVYFKAAI